MGGVDGFRPGHLLQKKSALEELKALKSVVSNSLRNLSPLFHEGGQTFELINLAILPSEGGGLSGPSQEKQPPGLKPGIYITESFSRV
jgi:hypothetical protein